ncbi:SMP-30/gluconolactonase/LRE family protein [Allokutzneria sp. A3M-2-11 16]|uniref:SMP-30/gluconolactonase/LRE family protein n=1 Tax=Allokutzneria sp. A3M-2-11 16 TaxID=2962043 RepID=UPI0020B7FBDC|nr:SMP-30/gluconolactonase/LRE family protein [Allokutzneria sp. A3M-2-11 16]MCP3799448.1 SMP-30/gluconolactonase/LRE family protein [Allokutzneria sp. A3M-2-11 16]
MSKLIMGRRSLLALAVAATAAVTLAPVAAAGSLPEVVTAKAQNLFPEGITWDPLRRSFLVTSISEGTISVVRPDGRVRPFAAHPRMVQTFGVHVDEARNRVLVAFGDMGSGRRSTPETTWKSSGVGIFSLTTGRLLHLVDLVIGPGRHAANDLAIDRAGNAYVTDPASDTLYRVDPQGRPSVLVRDPKLGSSGIGMNGIVWHPNGFLLSTRYDTGALLRIPLDDPRRITEVRLDRPLAGGDGLDLRPDGTLAVVTNAFGGNGKVAVSVLRADRDWTDARAVRRVEPWADSQPSTIARTPHGSYVLDGRMGVWLEGQGKADRFTLRRL